MLMTRLPTVCPALLPSKYVKYASERIVPMPYAPPRPIAAKRTPLTTPSRMPSIRAATNLRPKLARGPDGPLPWCTGAGGGAPCISVMSVLLWRRSEEAEAVELEQPHGGERKWEGERRHDE